MARWTLEQRFKGAMLLLLVCLVGMVVLVLTGVFPWEGSLDELAPR